MPSQWFSFNCTYTPQAVIPEMVPAKLSPSRSRRNSACLYRMLARSASEAIFSMFELCLHNTSIRSRSSGAPPSR